MNRRQLIAVMAAISGGGAVATGTGAFSSVTADRSVSVSVADDSSAYLRIAESNSDLSEYIDTTNGEFSIALDGNGQGQGINVGATTVFKNLFEIRNQGTQEIEVDVSPLAFSETDGDSKNALTLQVPNSSFPTFTLGTGDTEKITLIAAVDSGFDIDPDAAEISEEIEIKATPA